MSDVAELILGNAAVQIDRLSLESVAQMLAFAERDHCDGWMMAKECRTILSEEPPVDRHEAWRAAVLSLVRRYTDLSILLPGSDGYPQLLSHTGRAPAFLFVRGLLNNDRGGSIAIVGSRRASDQATETAREIAASLASTGMTIVSGLARGIDTAAHRGALSAEGHTTAVIGTGIDVVYPPENRHLVEEIAWTGAVVSQFPPGSPPSKTSFPVRNAVIAGLSRASLVVEAEESSGTRIEMDYALEFGRPVLLWAPVMDKRPWACSLASDNKSVHLVRSTSEIQDLMSLS